MTDSAFQLVDNLDPWTITDFEILLNPSLTIVATNPGQFYYHQRGTNTSGANASMRFDLTWPCDFVTQGAQPIHAYVQYAGEPNNWRDWTPQSSPITWKNADSTTCSKTTTGPTAGTGTITVNNVPANAKVWVTLHLDYTWKSTTAPSSNFGNPPILYTPFTSTIKIGNSGTSSSSASLLGRGKKVTVVYGTVSNSAGDPMNDVWLRLTQGSNMAFAQTGTDGIFVIYDGQGCSDGLEGCTGASPTTWTFANGNASSKLDIVGDGATTPLFTASAAYPGSMTKAWVKTGTTFSTSPNFTSPTALSHTFTVAKNSAYSRDWKFSP
jgi:hypothetical protein